MNFNSNILSNFNNGTVCYTTTPNFFSSYFSQNLNDSTLTNQDINWVNPFVQIGNTPDYRLNGFSFAAIGANFPLEIFGNIVSIKEMENNLEIYPNPANNIVYVTKKSQLELIDVNGITIKSTNDNKLNLENLNAGTYFIKIDNQLLKKLIIFK